MHAQRPGPTHVRILNDLPVDCTSVSLTASVCVAQQETRLFTRSRNRLSRANRMPDCLSLPMNYVSTTVVRGTNHVTLPRNADLDYATLLARTTPHSNSALLPAAGALSSARRRARACCACSLPLSFHSATRSRCKDSVSRAEGLCNCL